MLKRHGTNRKKNDYPGHRITTPGGWALQCPHFKTVNRQGTLSLLLMIHSDKDSIVAVATPAGRGGIGILRLSFEKNREQAFIERLFGNNTVLVPRHAHLLPVLGEKGECLDQAIVLFFPAPHSYTGESVIEIQAHGGPVLMGMIQRAVLRRCADLELRMAEPGEFTKRAFLNGRIDLAQAEAVADLIDAVSESAVQAAGRSLSGDFSRSVRAVSDSVNTMRAFVEATLDFPDEEVDSLSSSGIDKRMSEAAGALRAVLANAKQGSILREGVSIAIVGSPNVGKSSLLNALAQEEVAIVTDIPGTTRDKIEHWISLNGIPVKMVDTAGIRNTSDLVESKGIERTLAEIRRADVVLHLKDALGAVDGDTEVLSKVLNEVRPGVPLMTVCNKSDLGGKAKEGELMISALTGEGIGLLKEKLLAAVGMTATTDGLFMARERHLICLNEALDHLEAARLIGTDSGMPELLAEELRLCGRALGSMLGETSADDILGMIFSKFCIGK